MGILVFSNRLGQAGIYNYPVPTTTDSNKRCVTDYARSGFTSWRRATPYWFLTEPKQRPQRKDEQWKSEPN